MNKREAKRAVLAHAADALDREGIMQLASQHGADSRTYRLLSDALAELTRELRKRSGKA